MFQYEIALLIYTFRSFVSRFDEHDFLFVR